MVYLDTEGSLDSNLKRERLVESSGLNSVFCEALMELTQTGAVRLFIELPEKAGIEPVF